MDFRHCALCLLAFVFALPVAAQSPSRVAGAKAEPLDTRLASGIRVWGTSSASETSAGQTAAQQTAQGQLTDNAGQIAALLSGPGFPDRFKASAT